jgi:lycopene cyclase domain-containing protein
MTTYLLLDLAFLGTVGLVALATWLSRRMPAWRLVAFTAIPLLVMTAIFDNVLVGVHIVSYDPELITGAVIGVAPVEDFSYAIAAVVLLPCLWALLAPRRAGDSSRKRDAP